MSLPPPSADELDLCARLCARIRAAIARDGALPFDAFMRMALYEPGLGYYSAGRTKLGAAGDFVTAPELGDVFARCIARAIAPVLQATSGDLLEIGAGSGAFAADIWLALERLQVTPRAYRILETSADLRERQRATVAARAPQALPHVEWLDAPPTAPWRGVLFANEVLDALPVRVFVVRGDGLRERRVIATGDDDPARAFAWTEVPADAVLVAAARHAIGDARLPEGYASEVCEMLAPWIESVTSSLATGLALFVDYGYPRREYYLPQRTDGTLIGHYRHRALGDVLRWPGLVDLTASVDFTAVAEAGHAAGLTLAAYAPQAPFLIAGGLGEVLQETMTLPDVDRLRATQQVKRLTLPGDMGERFQAIAFARAFDAASLPFATADQRFRL